MDVQETMEQMRALYREKNEHLEKFLEPVTPFEVLPGDLPCGQL